MDNREKWRKRCYIHIIYIYIYTIQIRENGEFEIV